MTGAPLWVDIVLWALTLGLGVLIAWATL